MYSNFERMEQVIGSSAVTLTGFLGAQVWRSNSLLSQRL